MADRHGDSSAHQAVSHRAKRWALLGLVVSFSALACSALVVLDSDRQWFWAGVGWSGIALSAVFIWLAVRS